MPITTPDQPPTADVAETSPTPPRAGAADKLMAAIRTHPESTSAALAAAAGIGRSTAAKLLVRWAADNLVTRTTTPTSGQPGRGPERWSLPNPTTGPNTATADPATADPDLATDEGAESTVHGSAGEQTTDDDPRAHPDGGPPSSIAADVTDKIDATSGVAEIADTAAATSAQDQEPDPEVASRPHDDSPTEGPVSGPPRAVSDAGRGPRLPSGGLRGLVEDYLREHPDGAFGPSQIGKELSRSGGAVANALVKLVDAGCAVIVHDKPRRYQLAPSEANPSADART